MYSTSYYKLLPESKQGFRQQLQSILASSLYFNITQPMTYHPLMHSYSLAQAPSCPLSWPASTYSPALSRPDCGSHQLMRKCSEGHMGHAGTGNRDWGQSQPRHTGRVTSPSIKCLPKELEENLELEQASGWVLISCSIQSCTCQCGTDWPRTTSMIANKQTNKNKPSSVSSPQPNHKPSKTDHSLRQWPPKSDLKTNFLWVFHIPLVLFSKCNVCVSY